MRLQHHPLAAGSTMAGFLASAVQQLHINCEILPYTGLHMVTRSAPPPL
jgi:hypothetical protein